MTNAASTYQKYANLQMAAEAIDLQLAEIDPSQLAAALTRGNDRASRFPTLLADQFVSDGWGVLAHKPDTATGFSGTLFKNASTGELVLSFRSTEFIDDAARDNQQTNKQEIRALGWALGQIDDMETWYASLQSDGLIDRPLTVTGYSLGGHLATAFSLLRSEQGEASQIEATYTFNGAGVGEVSRGTLTQVRALFHSIRADGAADLFQTTGGLSLYHDLKRSLGKTPSKTALGQALETIDKELGKITPSPTNRPLRDDYSILQSAIARALDLRIEVDRVEAGIPDESPAGRARPTNAAEVAGLQLNYQLALLGAGRLTNPFRTGTLENGLDAFLGRHVKSGLRNVFDVYGNTSPSAVSNSQWHYGAPVPVWIEDQPLYRGTVVRDAEAVSRAYLDIKLLVDNFSKNDFGDTHSLVLLVDSLSVQSTLAALCPSIDQSQLQIILRAASNSKKSELPGTQGLAEGDVLENIATVLGRIFLGPATTKLSGNLNGGTWANIDERNTLYSTLKAIKDSKSFQDIMGRVTIVPTAGNSGLPQAARTDFAAFLSLLTLSPLTVRSATADESTIVEAALASAWGGTRSDWLADKVATESGGTAENFTDVWLSDRQALLQWQQVNNLRDLNGIIDASVVNHSIPETTTFEDRADGIRVQVGLSGATPNSQVVFGGSASESLTGTYKVDHFYGGAGNDTVTALGGADYLAGNTGNDGLYGGDGGDTLLGGAGNDTLKGETGDDLLRGGSGDDDLDGGSERDVLIGGDGSDRLQGGIGDDVLKGGKDPDMYVFAAGWGKDTIEDTDGLGAIQVTGFGVITGAGATKIAEGQWESADKRVLFTIAPLSGSNALDISFKATADDINKLPDTIRINKWTSGSLGIALGGEIKAPVTDRTIAGDFEKQRNSFGDYIVAADHNYVSAGPVDSADDVITGSTDAGDLLRGLKGNDALAGLDGDDAIDGGEGEDLILGGPGRDTLDGGAGRDVIFGSGNGALSLPSDPATPPPVADGLELTRGFSWVWWKNTEPDANGFQTYRARGADYSTLYDAGNLIDGGAGSDWIYGATGGDTIHGGEGDDEIAGSAGEDTLFGDDGDDTIEGDGVDVLGYIDSVPAPDQANDLLVGGAGRDTLLGEGGDDELDGGDGDDLMFGDASNPKITPFAYHGNDYLDGGLGDDELQGGGKDDELFGGTGGDSLFGDASLNVLDGSYHGDDYLDGEEGDDYLEGGGGADTLFGGDGNDMLWGDASTSGLRSAEYGADELDGEGGDDTLIGGGNGDTLYGGDGNDALYGDRFGDELGDADQGADYLDGEAGNDSLWGDGGADTLLGGDGDDLLIGDGDKVAAADEGNDILEGGAGKDTLDGNGGDDFLEGGADDDYLDAGKGSDYLAGDTGADYLVGDAGDDYLDGGAGDDQLLGGTGDDALAGGTGADYLSGGTGNDTYLFSDDDSALSAAGFRDTVDDADGDNLVAVDTAAPEAVISSRSSSDFVIALASGGRIGVVNGAVRSTTHYQFGGASPITLFPTTTLGAAEALSSPDVPSSDEGTGETTALTYSVSELIGTFSEDGASGTDDEGHVHVLGGRNADTITSSSGNATISGGRGDDTITGSGGGNTYLYSVGDGRDLLIDSGAPATMIAAAAVTATTTPERARGDISTSIYPQLALKRSFIVGNDDDIDGINAAAGTGATILASQAPIAATESLNRIVFGAGITSSDIRLSGAAGALTLNVGADPNDSITLGSFDQGAAGAVSPIESFVFADGTTLGYAELVARGFDGAEGDDILSATASADRLDGHDGDDQLFGRDDADTLLGGAGNDLLSGGSGSDRYVFATGDGQDTIDNLDASAGKTDVLFLSGIAETDVRLFGNGTDLLIKVGDAGDQVTVANHFVGAAIDRIEFGDGALWGAVEILSHLTRSLTDGPDSVTGTDGDDVVLGLGGNDTVFALGGADLVEGDAGNDELHGGAGADRLLGGDGADSLWGDDGDDVLDGGIGIDLLRGGDGNDVLIDGEAMSGGDGDDQYALTSWSRNVAIDESLSGNDALTLPDGVAPAQVGLLRRFNETTRDYDDLLLIGPGDVQLTIPKYLYAPGGDDKVEQIRFADGTAWDVADVFARLPGAIATEGDDTLLGFRWDDSISGGGGGDQIYGGGGNDTLDGEAGNDTLSGSVGADVLDGGTGADSLAGGSGDDTYVLGAHSGRDIIAEEEGDDRVLFSTEVAPGDVTLFRNGTDLVIAVSATAAQTRVHDYFDATTAQIESLVFGDGTVWDAAAIAARTLAGSPNAMTGTSGNDVFVVDDTRDTITEGLDQGIDTVLNSVSFNLPANVEDLTMTGYVDIAGGGNSLDNRIVGNAGDNVLHGGYDGFHGDGADTLVGGLGDDVYFMDGGQTGGPFGVDAAQLDTVIENLDEGFDSVWLVRGPYTFTIPDNVEALYVTDGHVGSTSDSHGPFYRSAIGNASDNWIELRNQVSLDPLDSFYWILDGGTGADTLRGGDGGDIYVVDNPGDVVDERAISGAVDTVRSTISYSLGERLENLELIGSDAIDGTGNALNNVLDGSANTAQNLLRGGRGDDVYRVGADDRVGEALGEGVDTVEFAYRPVDGVLRVGSVDTTSIERFRIDAGLGGAMTIVGSDSAEEIVYSSFDSPLLFPSPRGGAVEGWGGSDTLSGDHGSDRLDGGDGDDLLSGNEGWDTLLGGAGNDTLFGGIGNDVLDGGAGDDVLDGGFHDDVYLFGFGDGRDVIAEGADASARKLNIVRLRPGVQVSDVTVSQVGSDALILLAGGADQITLRSFFLGDDPTNPSNPVQRIEFADGTQWGLGVIRAKAHPDLPNASPFVATALADVTQRDDQVIDITVPAGTFADPDVGDALSYSASLANGAPLPSWIGFDASTRTFHGNAGVPVGMVSISVTATDYGGLSASDVFDLAITTAGNVLVGTSGSDRLVGFAGNDTLFGLEGVDFLSGMGGDDLLDGGDGLDFLDGGIGRDTMLGGTGNDSYVVDDAGDVVVENAGEGIDAVSASTSYVLAENVENLALSGGASLSASGNSAPNNIQGNSGDNRIDGGAGADTMQGGGGNDTFVVDDLGDVVVPNSLATSTIESSISWALAAGLQDLRLTGSQALNGSGNSSANHLYGNSGDNRLTGGGGADTIAGGAGDDTYVVSPGCVLIEDVGGGVETVESSDSWTLGSNVENLKLTGTPIVIPGFTFFSDFSGVGNELANVIVGSAYRDIIDGKAGADMMSGGLGDDVYLVDNPLDAVVELAAGGVDRVESSISWALGPNIEHLTLKGTSNIDALGNDLANVLLGNAGSNRIDGGTGTDTMSGSTGDDTYVVDNAGDVVTELAAGGFDAIESSVGWTLGAELEKLTLIGAADLSGFGNSQANALIGNAGSNRLDGGPGADSMSGGLGDDVYIVDNVADRDFELPGAGDDEVDSSVTFSLAPNVENLVLTGAAAIDGTGNELANRITGNSSANRLAGGAGNDVLLGDAGADALDGGGGDDTLDGGAGADTLDGGSGDDTYSFGRGSGSDSIAALDTTAGKVDTVLFGAGIAAADVVVSREVDDLVLTLRGSSDTLRVRNHFVGNVTSGSQIDSVRFADGTLWTVATIQSMLAANHAPTLLAPLGDQAVTRGSPFSYAVPAVTFADADGDPLTYSARLGDGSLLPAWLTFDAPTRTFSGSSGTAALGVLSIRVTASDPGGLSANDVFDLTVRNPFTGTVILGTPGDDVLFAGAGDDTIFADAGNDLVFGGVGDNALYGEAGSDYLDGGVGRDTAIGGNGDDYYVVDRSDDVVIENFNEGNDVVDAQADYILPANVETLWLSGSATSGTGNALVNTIGAKGMTTVGLTLDGGVGADAMYGSFGNDTYVIDSDGDAISEPTQALVGATIVSNTSSDTVKSSITLTLPAFAENLMLTAVGVIDGTGNTVANNIVGNAAANLLLGAAGNDTIDGGGGADTLDGGAGNDLLNGGAWNDTYLFGLGSGGDIIDAFDPSPFRVDTLQLANGIFAGDIALSRVADDLVVALRGTSDSVVVRNHFVGSSAGGHQIDLIRFADGSAWDVTAIATLAGAVNRSPIVSTPLADQSSLEDSSFSFVVPINTFSDPDAGDVLTFSAKLASGANLPSWLSFNAGTRTFGGTPLNGDVGVWSIQVAAIDQVGASVVDTFDLGVVNTNDPPEALDDSRSVLENATTGNLTAGLLANDNDVDGGDRKTIVAVDSTASMGMVSFDRAAQLLTYAANGAALDALRAGATTVDTFAYTMADAAGATSTATASVTVMGVNDAPTLVGPVPDRVAIAGTPFNFAVLPGAFVDVDAGDVLSYAAGLAGDTALPSWLSFDAATQTFSGTPADADVRTWTVSLTATDGSEASARDTFDIAVKGVNHAPLLTNPIPVQSANADAAFTYIAPADTFTDVDIGDTLTYGAGLASGAALPAWLAFDAATRTFSGTPHAGDIGRISVKLIATDGGDASASDVFDLTVSKAEDVIHIVPTTLVPILENATSANLAPSLFAHSSEAGLGETRAITGVDATGTLGVVSFDAATQTLTYAANGAALDALPAGVTYTDSFSYTLADAAGDRATSNVAMVVTGANDAPMLVAALADQDVTPGDSLDFQLPAAAFTDSDTGDAMSYAATLADGSSLPAWMSFDATSRSFSCDVPASNFADVNIKVTATDTGGMSASDLFALRMVTPDGGPIGWPLGDDDPWYPRRAGIGLRTVAAIHQGGATSDNFALGRHTSALIEAMAAFDAPAGGPLHMGSAHLFNTMPVIASPLSI